MSNIIKSRYNLLIMNIIPSVYPVYTAYFAYLVFKRNLAYLQFINEINQCYGLCLHFPPRFLCIFIYILWHVCVVRDANSFR